MNERLAFSLGPRAAMSTPATALASAAPIGAALPAAATADTERDWAFSWTIFFTLVLFLRPQDILPPLETLHLAELSAIAGLGALFFSRLRRGDRLTMMTPEFAAVLMLGAVILVTAPFGIWLGGSIQLFSDLYAKVILVYLLAINVLSSPRKLERLTWVLVLAVSYIALRAVIDYARGVNMVGHGTRVRGSVGGVMQNPNDLALNMVAFLPFAAFFALRSDASWVKRLTALACAVFMLGAIVASGSRGGTLGLVAMLAVLAVYTMRTRPSIVIAGILAAMCALPLLPASYWRRIASITDESKDDTGSAASRKELLGESWDAFVQNPLFGVGAGNFKDWNPEGRAQPWHESHDVFLQVAAELGIMGVFALTFLIARAFISVSQTRSLLRRVRARRPRGPTPRLAPEDATFLEAHSAAMVASLTGWFVCALFASVAYNWTFYYLLALAATPHAMLLARIPGREAARA